MKTEELYHETNLAARKRAILNKINKQIETRIQVDREYFELLDEEVYEDYMHNKYGYGLGATMLIASGETSMDLTFKDI